MISCYELRIGNYVLVESDIKQVSMINSTTVHTVDAERNSAQPESEHDLENIQPVLLTDDVLKQCGFIYHDYFKFWQLITSGIRSEIDINSDYDVIDFARKPILRKLRFLHQLQNVYFMLKGRELAFHQAQLLTGN
jgi:hypothetical protein